MTSVAPLTILSAANSFDRERFADHQLARALATQGRVLYVDPPTSPFVPGQNGHARFGLGGRRLTQVAPNLYRYSVRSLPGPERPGVAPLTAAMMRRGIRHAAAAIGGPIGVHIAASVLLPVFDPTVERASIFWYQDDFVGGAELMGVDPERNRRGEEALIRGANRVVAASPVLVDRCAALGVDAECIPFGCDLENFPLASPASPPADVTLTGPYALAMGQLGDRIDFALLDAIARRGLPLLMLGPAHDRAAVQRLTQLTQFPNVQWLGERPFSALPAYLAGAGVGLVPYRQSAFNRGSFPLKTLEYLASGLPVVATDLPATRWLAAPDVVIAGHPRGFADAVAECLRQPRTESAAAQRRTFAANHTWSVRAVAWQHVLATAARTRELSCVS